MSNYEIFVFGWIAIGFLSFPFILRYDAPYGRHTSNNWGPLVDNKIGWIVMELPALIVCPLLVLSSGNPLSDVTKFFIILWVIHYFNRSRDQQQKILLAMLQGGTTCQTKKYAYSYILTTYQYHQCLVG